MAPDRNPLITRLGSNYTILETTQVVEKNGGQGRIDSRSESRQTNAVSLPEG